MPKKWTRVEGGFESVEPGDFVRYIGTNVEHGEEEVFVGRKVPGWLETTNVLEIRRAVDN